MLSYLLVRLLRWGTGLFLILFVTYAMMYYGAGDPIERMFLDADDVAIDEVALNALRKKYGLDKPFIYQFLNYMNHLLHGDLGYSIREKRPVNEMVAATLPISLQLGLAATFFAALIGIPLGILAANRHNSGVDYAIVGTVNLANAFPVYVTGPLLILFLVVGIQAIDVPWGWNGLFSKQSILPIFVLTLVPLPIVVRQTRAAVLEVKNEDYIRTARAKGLPNRDVLFGHMLRPVLMPVLTALGLVAITLVNGAIFVELIFGIPGFGGMTLEGLLKVDYPVIMATVLIGAVIVMVTNFLVDLAYPFLDARVTRGR